MIRSSIPVTFLFACSTILSASPCVPGTLATYINLGATGCQAGPVQFSDFMLAPGQSIATPIPAGTVQVTPVSASDSGTLLLTLNATASSRQVLESFFRFTVTGPRLNSAF